MFFPGEKTEICIHFSVKKDFAHQCLHYICQNAGQLFGSEEFLQIDLNLLCELFERDQLLINDEFEIWQAALRWADEKWRQKGNNVCSPKKRRALLGPALFKIRFPLISPENFTESIFPSGILTSEEMFGIYQFHCLPNLRGVPGLKPLKFHGRISDWNIAKGNKGTLALEIEKFSEFAREEVRRNRESDTDVFIKGLPWKIFAEIQKINDSTEKGMVFGLWCTFQKKSGTENLTKKYDRGFNNEMFCWRFPFLITFTELMDPSKGFYDKIEDKVILTIHFNVEGEKGT
ncbi:hypothetical protein niasHT_028446 [Heterodera trifolii]|uniref:BACK domain-containing protein n=1 Tax=Heterodera trifolii TaxID=157864 RepID=A0ABD2KIR8_9BILA